MKAYHPLRRLFLVLLTLTISLPAWSSAQQIPSPEQFFGHQMGADRQLARWDKLVEYYDMIGERSDRVRVVPGHICPCINLHDAVHVVEGDEVIDRWTVDARGKVL